MRRLYTSVKLLILLSCAATATARESSTSHATPSLVQAGTPRVKPCVVHVWAFSNYPSEIRNQGPLGDVANSIVNGLVHGNRKATYLKLMPQVLDASFQTQVIDKTFLQQITGVPLDSIMVVNHDSAEPLNSRPTISPDPTGSCRADFSVEEIQMISTATWTGIRVKGVLKTSIPGRKPPDFSKTVIAGLHLFEQKTVADQPAAIEDFQAAYRLALSMIRDKAPNWKNERKR